MATIIAGSRLPVDELKNHNLPRQRWGNNKRGITLIFTLIDH
jgi:hypothetical protein